MTVSETYHLELEVARLKEDIRNFIQSVKAKDNKIKQYKKVIDEVIEFTENFYDDGNHNPLSTKTKLTEILSKLGNA